MARKNKLDFLTYDILYQLHWVEEKSIAKIATLFNVVPAAIRKRAKKFNFLIRDSASATRLAISGEKHHMKKPEVIIKFLGKNNPFYGKKHSAESIKKISEQNKKYFEKNGSPLKGIANNSIKGDLNPMRNPVFVAKLKETYRKNRSKYSGENSSNWKGGISKLNESIRALPEYNTWRALCFARDNRTCQICEVSNSEFNVDHIKPFSTILHDNNIKTIEEAIGCQELWDIDNGRVLCVQCHKNTDTYGGRTRN